MYCNFLARIHRSSAFLNETEEYLLAIKDDHGFETTIVDAFVNPYYVSTQELEIKTGYDYDTWVIYQCSSPN